MHVKSTSTSSFVAAFTRVLSSAIQCDGVVPIFMAAMGANRTPWRMWAY